MKIEEESKTPGLHGIPHLGRQRLVCSCECCKKNEHLPHPNNKDHGKAMSKVVIASKSNMSWKRDHRHASNWGASASMRGCTHLEYNPLPTLWLNSKNWREIFHDITVILYSSLLLVVFNVCVNIYMMMCNVDKTISKVTLANGSPCTICTLRKKWLQNVFVFNWEAIECFRTQTKR